MGEFPTKTEAETIRDLALDSAEPTPLRKGDLPGVFVLPEGRRTEIVDPSVFEDTPRRTIGSYTLADIPSLIDYGKQHAAETITTVWIDQLKARVVVVFNDADGETAGWRDHRAVCDLIRTPEWEHWTSKNGQYLDQLDFAEHIEDGLLEIIEPPSADMWEIAQSIRGRTDATWRAEGRLDNGAVGFSYIEDVKAEATTQKGRVEIPSEFRLRVAPFYGEEPAELVARLRYRVREGALKVGYKLDRPDQVELQVMKAVKERLGSEGGFGRVYLGVPAA
jgi:uncharacterized protein YfdQ (DUF2303 family)